MSSVIPGLKYRKAPEAIEWLCSVFGFEKHAVFSGPDNTIMHAELTLGGGMIMLGSRGAEAQHSSGLEMQGCYLVVSDADAICAQAKAAGAEIVSDVEDQSYGGRAFTCRDPEGRIWNVGTYDPWAPK